MYYCTRQFHLASETFPLSTVFLKFLFIYLWLCWVFISAHGLSLVAASRGYSLLRCVGFSLGWLLLLRRMALGAWASVLVAHGLYSIGSVVVAHGLSCSAACGIFLDQGSNSCPLHWQAPLCHQGSPPLSTLII